MRTLYCILELIMLACLVVLVHIKADIRMVVEAGVIYLAAVIRNTWVRNTWEGEE